MNGISAFLLGLVAASKATLFTEATTSSLSGAAEASTTTTTTGAAAGEKAEDGFASAIMGATILGSSLFVLA
ncbi:hypothetical protein BgAZ_402820 [Babesia gibsoni]|uniref:Uncharacterized protein n=1 Tax=Babesia gibsoni TaxID=33632 RepID=A0AAD8PCP0_BABGI|nr:hypothetical protein BgAZ_402780 [Babesia gibsoni]KAK1442252.1 hypothetical protein BgAZ_402820 [Babesia gibsoni]